MPGWAGRRLYSRDYHRNRVLVRRRSGGACEVIENGARCTRHAHAVDHIVPQSRGGGDELANLQDICEQHHTRKTAAEAAEGRKLRQGMARRPQAQHPGTRARKDY